LVVALAKTRATIESKRLKVFVYFLLLLNLIISAVIILQKTHNLTHRPINW
jgi:hypothetical protein